MAATQSSDSEVLGFDGKPGSSKTQVIPSPLPALKPYQSVSVACGTDHVVALTTFIPGDPDKQLSLDVES